MSRMNNIYRKLQQAEARVKAEKYAADGLKKELIQEILTSGDIHLLQVNWSRFRIQVNREPVE